MRKQISPHTLCTMNSTQLSRAGYKFYGLNRGTHEGKTGIWYREWAPGAKVGEGSGSDCACCLGKMREEEKEEKEEPLLGLPWRWVGSAATAAAVPFPSTSRPPTLPLGPNFSEALKLPNPVSGPSGSGPGGRVQQLDAEE